MTIYGWAKAAHELAKEKGWYDRPRDDLEALRLISEEVQEAAEELSFLHEPIYYLEGKPEGELIELADAALRLLDYCAYKGYDLEAAMQIKHEYNKTRPYRHGKD